MPLPPQAIVGAPVSASSWNALIREVKRISDLVFGGDAGFGGNLAEPAQLVLIKNSSGADRKSREILGIDGQLYVDSPVQNQSRVLDGVAPTTAGHTGKFVILRDEVPDGCSGWAYLSGACLTQVNVVNSSDTAADITNGDCTKLTSAETGGAQILWKEEGTGTKWALIRFPSGGAGGIAGGLYASPKDLSFAGAHTTEARGSICSWYRTLADDSPPNYEGNIVTVCVGVSYNPAGNLSAWYQDFIYDSAGMLVSISPERESAVDTPSDC